MAIRAVLTVLMLFGGFGVHAAQAVVTVSGTGVTSDAGLSLTGATASAISIGATSTTGAIAIGSTTSQNVSITDNNWSITSSGVASFVSLILNGASYAFPAVQGVAGTVLQNDGLGGLSWVSVSGTGDMLLSGVQTVTGTKTFSSGKFLLGGSTSGAITINAPAVAGSGTVTLPASGNLLSDATAVTVPQGGTGSSSTAGARTNLGAAASGANSDITSLTGLTTALSIPQGGTGATSASAAFNAFSPTTTLGDLVYNNGTGNVRLPGNTTIGKQFLSQIGTGAISAAPAWAGISTADISGLGTMATQDASNVNITGGTLSNVTISGGSITGGTAVGVASGGTGATSFTAFAPIFGGTTATSALQSGAVGTVGQVLTSNGAGALPTFQTLSSGGTVTSVSVVTANGVSGSVATSTTTPAITLSLGAVTPTSVAASGTVTGSNLSGTNTGDQTSVSGNAGTATALQTARTINGVSFDGTGNITVASAAGTLTGTTLNSTVVSSSLTGVGTITSGTWGATTIAVNKGGTGQTSYIDGQLLIGNSTGNTLTKATITAGTGISITNGNGSITIDATGSGAPTDATYITQTANSALSNEQALGSLTTGILKNTTTTGVLSIATAGTDYGTPSVTTLSSLAGVGTITSGVWNGTAIDVARGGTGLATLTANGVILGNGISSPTFVTPGTSGNVLTSNGTTWVSQALAGTGITSLNGLTGATQTFVNDTNVTIVSSGTDHTLGWSGILSSARGGTGISAAGSAGNYLRSNGTGFVSSTITKNQLEPADKSSTTSTTGVMLGLAGSITPANSGQVLIIISGDMDNSGAGNGTQVRIRYGTGTAPANGAALTGTTAGTLQKYVNGDATGIGVTFIPGRVPFSVNAIVPNLAITTAYWVDLEFGAITGGTARVRDVSMSIVEL